MCLCIDVCIFVCLAWLAGRGGKRRRSQAHIHVYLWKTCVFVHRCVYICVFGKAGGAGRAGRWPGGVGGGHGPSGVPFADPFINDASFLQTKLRFGSAWAPVGLGPFRGALGKPGGAGQEEVKRLSKRWPKTWLEICDEMHMFYSIFMYKYCCRSKILLQVSRKQPRESKFERHTRYQQ